jgi:DNA-binding transcriptional MerR regulator
MGEPAVPAGGEPADRLLSIGVFARRSRLSLKALRLYDRLGLLAPAHVDPGSGYRRYRESQLTTARLIAKLRRLDMPLANVARVVSAPGGLGAELLTSYWESVERRVAGQRQLVALLRLGLLGGEVRFGPLQVREREVPEQLVLAERRHVLLEELAGWIQPTLRRLTRAAERRGGCAGDRFVIFHGEVSEDSDGPVEVCVPVASGRRPPAGVTARREPAHREAYVRLTRAQYEFPQVLSAYDLVAQWISGRGLSWAGSPREVQLAGAAGTEPADEVCDVAYPIAG